MSTTTTFIIIIIKIPNSDTVSEYRLQEALFPGQRHAVRLDPDHGLEPHQDCHRRLQQAHQGAG